MGGDPLAIDGLPAAIGSIGLCAWVTCSLAASASAVMRFRRSRGAERQQMKWFTAAVVLLALAFVLSGVLTPVVGDEAGWAIAAAGLLGVAVAVGIAILRHRLYDIDVVVNRALVYGGSTAALGATYLVAVVLIGLAVGRSGFAVAASTLAVAALLRVTASRRWSTAASTAASTTRSARSKGSRRGCATRWRSRPSTPSCAASFARPCSPPTSPCG